MSDLSLCRDVGHRRSRTGAEGRGAVGAGIGGGLLGLGGGDPLLLFLLLLPPLLLQLLLLLRNLIGNIRKFMTYTKYFLQGTH